MVILKDEGLYIVVYYKDEEKKTDSEEETEDTSESTPMGIVPDFWIDIDELFVLWPPYRTDRKCNLAIYHREKPSESWIKHDIIEGRFETGKTDYYEALQYLKDCQSNSSGADDLFESKNDKVKRKYLHKNPKFSEGNGFSQTDFQELGLASIKKENYNKNKTSLNEMIANLPTAPPHALLLSHTSQAAASNTRNSTSASNLAKTDAHSPVSNNVGQTDSKNVDIVKIAKIKPTIKESKQVSNFVKKTPRGFVKPAKDKVATEQSANDGVPSSFPSVDEAESEFAPIDLNILSQYNGALQEKAGAIGPSVSSDSSLINVLCEIMKAVDVKLNLLITNQNQLIVNQCRDKIVGGNVAVPCEEDWLETKTLMRRVFDDIQTYELFLDFDKQIKESRKLRKKVVKYLMEQMDTTDWKLTARLLINAVMHLNVQQRFSGVGQKGKESLIKTNTYKILEAIVQAATKDDQGKCKVSTTTIQRYFGKYVKSAKTRAGGYESTKKPKNGKKRVSLVEQLLFDDIDDGNLAEIESDDQTNDEDLEGPKQKKSKMRNDNGDANLNGNELEMEVEAMNEAEQEEVRQRKLTENKERKAQRSLFDEILNGYDSKDQEQGIN